MIMDMGLNGKVAVITGGSEGIGKSIGMSLSKEGASIAICARRIDILEKAASEIRESTGGQVLTVNADVTKEGDVKLFIESVIEKFGRIDILVNNAGRSAAGRFMDVSDEEWIEDFNLKFYGAVWGCRYSIPHMRKIGGGRIVNVTTIHGKQPGKSSMPTSISRAAGMAFTKALSRDHASDNILVNTICLGSVKSAQWKKFWKLNSSDKKEDEYYREVGREIPLGRMGEAEEVANLVTFLVSDRAGFITGTSINVDGGASAVL